MINNNDHLADLDWGEMVNLKELRIEGNDKLETIRLGFSPSSDNYSLLLILPLLKNQNYRPLDRPDDRLLAAFLLKMAAPVALQELRLSFFPTFHCPHDFQSAPLPRAPQARRST